MDFKTLLKPSVVILSEAKDLCNLLAAPECSPQPLELLCDSVKKDSRSMCESVQIRGKAFS